MKCMLLPHHQGCGYSWFEALLYRRLPRHACGLLLLCLPGSGPASPREVLCDPGAWKRKCVFPLQLLWALRHVDGAFDLLLLWPEEKVAGFLFPKDSSIRRSVLPPIQGLWTSIAAAAVHRG